MLDTYNCFWMMKLYYSWLSVSYNQYLKEALLMF